MGKLFLFVAGIAFAIYFAATPYIAVSKMNSAIDNQDSAALQEYLDVPKIQANFSNQINDLFNNKIEDEIGQLGGDSSGAAAAGSLKFLKQMTQALVSNMVEKLTSPAGLMDAVSQKDASGVRSALRDAKKSFQSHSRFLIVVDRGTEDEINLVMHRQGLKWKIAEISFDLTDQLDY